MKFVSIIMGSKKDYDVMRGCADTLEAFGVPYELIISSSYRSPERTREYVEKAEAKGAQVFIAASGMAAHLAGALASKTIRPIIGVPMKGGGYGWHGRHAQHRPNAIGNARCSSISGKSGSDQCSLSRNPNFSFGQ